MCNRPIPSVRVAGDLPQASIVVVTLNNVVLTRMTLESVLVNTMDVPYELIVVDNGSDDATRQYLSVMAAKNRHVRVVPNDTNRGFAAATNQGLQIARGEVVALLNNDTIVPPGWLAGLARHLQDPSIGLVGPATNRCGNEAEIPTSYDTYGEMLAFAHERHHRALEPVMDLPVATMFCVALQRSTLEAVGLLDERYEIGMFEDDDYSLRVREEGKRVVCAEDVFVHHFGEGSLGVLAAVGAYGELFETNRRRFEQKWGIEWHTHGRRRNPAYDDLRGRLGQMIRANIPSDLTVLVVTRGDDLLLELPGYKGWHFPRAADGSYTGYHPVDDADAIGQLEGLRRLGASYLVIPAPYLWWLDHYEGLSKHLEERYRHLATEPATAAIYDLGASDEV
jgi:GT2 family glycosyltransferase